MCSANAFKSDICSFFNDDFKVTTGSSTGQFVKVSRILRID